jgi:hypothetical protein
MTQNQRQCPWTKSTRHIQNTPAINVGDFDRYHGREFQADEPIDSLLAENFIRSDDG